MLKTNFAIGFSAVHKNIEAQDNAKLFSPQQRYFQNEFHFSLEIKRFFTLTRFPTEIR